MTFPLRQSRGLAADARGAFCSVLLIHGAGGGGWEWRAWARVLRERGCQVHAPDLAPGPDGLAARMLAQRRWRNESGRVMATAYEGVAVTPDTVPTLVLGSQHDGDVPVEAPRRLAGRHGWDFVRLPGASHLGPLLGRGAADCAVLAFDWFRSRL